MCFKIYAELFFLAFHLHRQTDAFMFSQSFDDENESLPPYPNVDESFQSPTEMNTSVASTGEPKKRKPKKKTTTTTTKTSKKTYMDDEGNVVTEVVDCLQAFERF